MVIIPDDPPDEELTPAQLRERVFSVVNLSLQDLEAFRESDYNRVYLEENSDRAQPGNQPIDDLIRLLRTDAEDWRDEDDGFNEVAEAEELLDYQRRAQAQIRSQGLGENTLSGLDDMTAREAASIRWGIDPDSDREWL
jgi:hypothetical protein